MFFSIIINKLNNFSLEKNLWKDIVMTRFVNFDNIEKLIEKTVAYMLRNNLFDLDGGYRTKDNHFYNISREYFKNEFPNNAVLNLYMKWKRNDKNFRTKVLEELSLRNLKSEKSESFFCITIDILTWKRLLEFVSKTNRPKFLAPSNEIFEKLFLQNELKCQIKLHSNSFTTSKKRIPGRLFWKANFICIKCGFEFKAYISKEPKDDEPVELVILSFVKNCLDDRKIIKKRIYGEQRRKIQYEAVSKGVLNFKSEAHFNGIFFTIFLSSKNRLYFFIKGDQEKMSISSQNLRKMRSQFKHQFQLSNELRIDSDAAKLFFDSLLDKHNNITLKGFVQEINSNPFGFLLMTEIQVKLLFF